MLESVRVRLTLWYTSALALVLIALSLATYFILRRSTAHRTDSNITEISEAFLTTLQAEMKDEEEANEVKDAAREAMIEHRFRDQIYVIFDSQGQLLLTSSDSPFTNSSPGSQIAEILASDSFRSLVNAASHESRVFQNVAGRRGGYRGYARHFQAKDNLYLLVVLQSRHSQQEMLEEIATTFEWAIPISLLLASRNEAFSPVSL